MRNLKRALSLTLASVMLLGMMVVGSSAAGFPDVDENDNVEAIEVLNAVDVILGYDNGDFGPDDLVTRAQMAVIMAKLLNLDYQYYEATCPFTDVPEWARGYVGACYANGITSGYSATIYGSNDGITPVQSASMMMRALGYFKHSQDYADGFEVSTVRQGTQVGIFEGVGSSATASMTRNQVAQMALNALKSEMVTFTGTPGMEVNGVVVGYRAEYTPRTSTETKYQAIERRTSDVSGGNNLNRGQYYVQLGEELYNGNLKLNDDSLDVFGRPANTWTYMGTEVGTYAKKELLVHEAYVTGVTGREVYDLLGQSTIRDNDLVAYLDGYVNGNNAVGNLVKNHLVRSNNSDLAGTGRGVLTEIYLDNDKELITIVSINTYLAKANADYNESAENISMNVYNSYGGITKLVELEDVPGIANLKKGDWVLVNWADESSAASDKIVVDMFDVEIMENVDVTGFASSTEDSSNWNAPNDPTRRVTEITTGGTTYKNNVQAYYKQNTLNNYFDNRLADKTYTLYMDQYGNFIGAELYSGQDQYVFITGYDRPLSAIGMTTANANGIFTDGTMATISVNVTDTNKNIAPNGTPKTGYTTWITDQNHEEMWYSYTLRNNVYTLTPVDGWTRTFATAADSVIDCSNLRLVPAAAGNYGTYTVTAANAGTGNAYGEDASIYITAEMGDVTKDGTKGGPVKKGVTEVTGRYTGVQNVKLLYQQNDWAHAVYDSDNNYIIACVVLGEAEGVTDNYAYIRDGAKNERKELENPTRSDSDYIYFWDVDVIMNGEATTKTIKSKYSNTTSQLVPGTVQELIMDADGYVTKINTLPNSIYNGSEVADNTLGAGYKDKVYSNYDYLNNASLTHSDGQNSTDLADYSVYFINTNDATFNAAATDGRGSVVQDGTTYYYNTMTLQGRTLKFDASSKDEGLAINSTETKAVIRRWENNKWNYVNAGTVSSAFGLLVDADHNGNNNPTNGLQFSGKVVAVLDSRGIAEWVFFEDNIKAQTKDTDYNPTVTGQYVDPGTPLSEVQRLLNDQIDVVINGSWKPADLGTTTNRSIMIPEGRTLTVLGDLNCRLNDGTNDIYIGAHGQGNNTGKLIVRAGNGASGTVTFFEQSVSFPVEAVNVDFRTGMNNSPVKVWNITRNMNVTGNFTLYGKNVVNVSSGATLTISGTLSTNSGDIAYMTVNGTVQTPVIVNGVTYVYSTTSLHVTNAVRKDAIIVVGNGNAAANNGYADIKTLEGVLIAKNVGAVSGKNTADIKETTSTAQISINQANNTVVIADKNETNKVAIASGASLTVPPTVNSTVNPGLLVDENNLPVTTTRPVTITASGGTIGTQRDVSTSSDATGGATVTDVPAAKTEVSDDVAGVEKSSPISAEIKIIKNAEDFTWAVNNGFKPDGANVNWPAPQTNEIETRGIATMPWLNVKITALAQLPVGTKITATVKLNGQEIGQVHLSGGAEKMSYTVTGSADAVGTQKTFHWEMSDGTNVSNPALNQTGGAKSGTYSVTFEVRDAQNNLLIAPAEVSETYTAPALVKAPAEGSSGLIYSSDDVGEGKTNLAAGVQQFTVNGSKIVVSSAYDMATYKDCTYAGMKIMGTAGQAWFAENSAYTHFIIVQFVNPYEMPLINHFKVVSAGAPDGNAGTIGTNDPATFIFAFNPETGASNAPITLYFGDNSSNWGTGWALDIDYSALKR